ncbi:hypothetical protein HBI56_117050 [Parastagonospora nodorum]|nr:hypothetical protein HBH50_124620 [Parastagonospora nodorum]KAH4085505.1 hypothetical protein HBH48_150530 [Parastagonospora nodorum]KAH6511284.1 hypothetical protein HBI56_117050 [Parastagonospora nodorum]
MTATRNPQPATCNLQPSNTRANMSTPRGGRGGERGRGSRGNTYTRGTAGRSRSNGAPTDNNTERPTQQIYARGGSRGANRGGAARGTTTTTTTAAPRGRGNHSNFTAPTASSFGGLNSTPFSQDDYAKRLEHIRTSRPKLRERFIQEGRMNPEGQMRLSDSVKLYGLCTDMCPEYERVRRIVEDDVKPPECTPETEHLPRKQRIPDESRMVKAYTRSAAGMDVELVSEIRSPPTCLKTLDYLMQRLDNDAFDFLHSWIWDRTRSIRKDLRTQRIESKSDINILLTCLERSARFFILSAHQMARSQRDDYVHQQDVEQLNQTITSLNERYADNRRINYPSENEAEFFAYRLVLAPLFSKSQYENDLQALPDHLRKNTRVKTAIVIHRAINAVILDKSSSFNQAQANWKKLWSLIKSSRVSYLMACAAEFSFQRVRHTILDTLWRAYRYGNQSRPQTIESWTVAKLRETMAFDTDAETVEFCEMFGFQFNSVDGGPVFLDVTARGFSKDSLDLVKGKDQIFSQGIVEEKRKGRAFSAVVQGMSVQEAERRSLMSGSSREETNGETTNGETEDDTSLFVPEARSAQSNVFTQPKSSFGPPTTNPFLPKTAVESNPTTPKPNPFLPSQQAAPVSGAAAKPNPFLSQPPASTQSSAGSAVGAARPGLFNPSENSIKFASSDTATTPFAGVSQPNPFQPAAPANATRSATNGTPPPAFSFSSTPATQATPATTTSTPPSANTSTFVFPGLNEAALKASTPTPSFSFTPAGSPAPAASSLQDAEKQKAEEETRRQKQAADAEAQRQREQAELARRAEQQRIEAEQQRQRLQEEERNRQLREAQQAQMREQEERLARQHALDNGYQTLAENVMFDVNEGLMIQFVENLIQTTAAQVIAADRQEKLQKLREKQEAVADAMAHQRTLRLQRAVMVKLLARVEKKRRDQQVRDRRKRLREQKAKMANTDEAASDLPTPTESEGQPDRLETGATFRKPQAPASARRARRTEERRGTSNSQQNGAPELAMQAQQPAARAVLTPVSTNSSQTSNAGYSDSYRKSTAPIDRTETDWFSLRAEGYDPSTLRKRQFDTTIDEDQQDIESKRPKMSPSTEPSPVPQATSTADRRARLEAIGQQFRRSTGSPQAATASSPFNGRSSLGKSASTLIEQAKQVLARSKPSPPSVQHDFGRSVPNLNIHRRTMSAQTSVLGRSMGARNDRPAYWNRPSRFVPKECYGQGANAVRDYRIKYGLSSPANTRPNSIEPVVSASSPISTQMSYAPVNGYTQEQYSEEESSVIEIVDVDAEEENPGATEEEENSATTEEEYDSDDEGDEQLPRRQSHPKMYRQTEYDEDGDSPMPDDQDDGGYVNGQYADDALVDYEGYTEDSDADSDSDSETQFAQHVKPAQKKAAPLPTGGNCEEDAIELSD